VSTHNKKVLNHLYDLINRDNKPPFCFNMDSAYLPNDYSNLFDDDIGINFIVDKDGKLIYYGYYGKK